MYRVVHGIAGDDQRAIQRLRARDAPVRRSKQLGNVAERSDPQVVADDSRVVEDEIVTERVQVDDRGSSRDREDPVRAPGWLTRLEAAGFCEGAAGRAARRA